MNYIVLEIIGISWVKFRDSYRTFIMHKIIRDFIDTIVHASDARITREKDENKYIYIYTYSSNHCESKLIDEWNIIMKYE